MLTFLIIASTPALAAAWDFSIDEIQASLETRYDNISHIDHESFLQLDREKIAIFDVRQQDEFHVSHLMHAIQVEPNIGSKEFIQKFSGQIKDKHLIFYCSVGKRSSELASRLKPLLSTQNVHGIYNLKGGIFQWHNEKKLLVKNGEPTQFIHPFNSLWGLLIENRQFIKSSPDAFEKKKPE